MNDPDRHLLRISRNWRWMAVCALTIGVIILVLGLVGAVLTTISDHKSLAAADRALRTLSVQQARQRYQLVEACERLNVQRAGVNLNSYADFLVDRVVLVSSSPSAVISARERSFERSFLPQLRYAVRTKEWTPLIDCVHAVAVSGAAFKASRPIPFVTQRPPPSALDSANAQLPTPVGSH